MNADEIAIANRLETAIELMLQGALGDASASLVGIDASSSRHLSQLLKKMSLLVERVSESFAAKESAFASVQLSMLELEAVQEELHRDRLLLRTVIDHLPDAVYAKDAAGRKTLTNLADVVNLGYTSDAEILGKTDLEILPAQEAVAPTNDDLHVLTTGKPIVNKEESFINKQRQKVWVQTSKLPLRNEKGEVVGLVGIGHNISDRKAAEAERVQMELQLRQAQKLESIGQLAAGIAHEINTPTQYVGDNIRFLNDAFTSVQEVLVLLDRLRTTLREASALPELTAELELALESADLEYLRAEIPNAIKQSLDGVARVTSIVRAMKEFSHPSGQQKTPSDLNKALESTITVCRNEWKYVAEVRTEFSPTLPLVPVLLGEFNQAILNLLINAAHAIGDSVGHPSSTKGLITVRTRQDNDWAEVSIADTGTGIPENVRDRIFEPFFTTKEVGKGTGQGLAIARSVVVDKHGGCISFETETGKGSRFIIRLPIDPPQI